MSRLLTRTAVFQEEGFEAGHLGITQVDACYPVLELGSGRFKSCFHFETFTIRIIECMKDCRPRHLVNLPARQWEGFDHIGVVFDQREGSCGGCQEGNNAIKKRKLHFCELFDCIFFSGRNCKQVFAPGNQNSFLLLFENGKREQRLASCD